MGYDVISSTEINFLGDFNFQRDFNILWIIFIIYDEWWWS